MNKWYSIKEAVRWYSMQGLALLTTLAGVWMALPEETKALVPDDWAAGIMFAVGLLTTIGRMRKQSDV